MKLQYLAVIFVVIIIPISFVMSEYIQTQIDTITLQTSYKNSLNTATYDALKAFQINSNNNKYSNISSSKIRDIEASINTFYNSLWASMENYVSSKDDLSVFIPAIVFTLYDGYYIYSSYDNVYKVNESNGKVEIKGNKNYQDGLRPYIYYSCTYVLNGKNIIINYTLDNYISVYGDFGNGYETKSGYLINPDDVKEEDINETQKKLTYKGITIEPETLTEHLITIEDADTGTIKEADYQYIVFNNKKVYQDVNEEGNIVTETVKVPEYNENGDIQYDNGNVKYKEVIAPKYFWYENYKKTYLKSELVDLLKYLDNLDNKLDYKNEIGFKSIDAFNYYYQAWKFSTWVNNSVLVEIDQSKIVQNDGTLGATKNGELYLSVDTEGKNFLQTSENNDPMLSSSTFNTHRMAVIRKSIETNLTTAIANYNLQSGSNYEFVMPVIDEINWNKIVNHVSIISFMQGMPIGYKYFNQYSVITNTQNEEVINEQSLYILAKNEDGNYEYHQPGCKELIDKMIDKMIDNKATDLVAYTDLSFRRQTVKISEADIRYFYPQTRRKSDGTGNVMTTGCYNCIVNATADYDIDNIIKGEIKDYKTGRILYSENQLGTIRKAYLTGLARERYILTHYNSI